MPAPAYVHAPWRHWSSALFADASAVAHRGRDLILREGEAQWAIAKFAYGTFDKDLEDEDVDVYALRDCAAWALLGTARTSGRHGRHPSVEGVDDPGGRVFFEIPAERRLGPGRHRLLFVVRGDGTRTEALLDVLAAGAPVVVSDVDGTLTRSENALIPSIVFSTPAPTAHPGAAEALWALAHRGYHVFYLTARPEWLVNATRAWLRDRGFPPGILHTTLGSTGTMGAGAEAFKTAELRRLVEHLGGPPEYAFGNKPSDVATYVALGIDPARSYYFQLAGDLRGGHRVDDYADLIGPFDALPTVCP